MKKIIKKRLSRFIPITVAIVVVGLILGAYFIFRNPYRLRGKGAIKILCLNSYDFNFPLIGDNVRAFKAVFENQKIDIDFRQINLDLVNNPSNEYKNEKIQEIRNIVEAYDPDLIYAVDDESQDIIKDYVNTNIPIVFSGMNDYPETYGYDKARNVAGVLERVDFVGTINFLKQVWPKKIEKIAIISGEARIWELTFEQIKKEINNFPEINFTNWDLVENFDELKTKYVEYQKNNDAVIFFDISRLIKNMDIEKSTIEILNWIAKNSNIPEASFWESPVRLGGLLSVEISSEEQGNTAGWMAKMILINGKKPKEIGFTKTIKNQKYLNLRRAKQLGIDIKNIPSLILINTKIIDGI